MRKIVYCQFAFWESFFSYERSSQLLHNRAQNMRWLDFYDFLENSILHFDVEEGRYDRRRRGARRLEEFKVNAIQARGSVKNIVFCDMANPFPCENDITNDKNKWLNSIVLTCWDTKKCSSLSKRTGILVLNVEMILECEYLFKDSGEVMTPDNKKDWSFLRTYIERYPTIRCCNSLVITDRYLFKNTINNNYSLKNNILFILDVLLPHKMQGDICFYLCILTQKQDGVDMQEKYDYLLEMIRKIRPNLDSQHFSLTIYVFQEHICRHDRAIVTNNILLKSGNGFDALWWDRDAGRLKARQETITHLAFPFLCGHSDGNTIEYLQVIDGVSQILRHHKDDCTTFGRNIQGHLLDFYSDSPQPSKTNKYSIEGKYSEKSLQALRQAFSSH